MKELEELISKWRGVAKAPPYTADDEVESGVLIACADELEALLPALEKALDAHERLAVAVALRKAARVVRHTCGQDDSAITSHTEDCQRCSILAFIHPGRRAR